MPNDSNDPNNRSTMQTEHQPGIGPAPRATLSNIKPYVPGRAIADIRAQFGVERVVKLASNENPLGPSPLAIKAVHDLLPEVHRYPDDRAGLLVRKLAVRLSLPPSQLIVANGADELITLLAETYLDPGDRLVTFAPTFSEYEFGARLMNAETVKLRLREGFELSADDMLAAVDDRTKLVYVCSPNNPSGTYMPRAQLRLLLERLPAGCLLVLDAAYAHFADAPDYCDGFDWLREGDRLVILQTFSKAYGLAGLRVGYAAGPPDVIASMLRVKEPFNVNALAQAAAAAALDDEAHLAATLKTISAGRTQLREGLRRLGIDSMPSQANFVLADFGDRARIVYESLLRGGIIVRSGEGWNLPRHLRISVGTEAENRILLERLADMLPT
ncbi:histidinol-phosphate transaminase [Cohnella sp. 56]|uniref:histidinol-phosphate transaminase n=1 Tax=Cohnella sp. 56 TaxID=3113722 RepID=UPI0030EA9E04